MKGDFLGFSFDGIHCSQLGITHVSSSDRYDEDLFPEVKDKTIEVPNSHGEYYYGSTYGTRTFEINIAYDSITETQFRNIRRLFGTRKVCELIFDERPYKVYYAKIESPIEMSYVCFDEPKRSPGTPSNSGVRVVERTPIIDEETGEETSYEITREEITPWIYEYDESGRPVKQRIYKGEGTINLICYQPFAHQLFKIKELYEEVGSGAGNTFTKYDNVDEWIESSGILTREEWNQYSIDQIQHIGIAVNDSVRIAAGETEEYSLNYTPIDEVQITGIAEEDYTFEEDTYTFVNNTEEEIIVTIEYHYEDEPSTYNYRIPVYNPGDLNVGFCLYIPFSPLTEDTDTSETVVVPSGQELTYTLQQNRKGDITIEGMTIVQHYELTEDTTVVEGKTYYSKDGDVYTRIEEPTGNPHESNYYELIVVSSYRVVDNQTVLFQNNTEQDITVTITYVIESEVTQEILPKGENFDIIINGDTEILVLKPIKQKNKRDTGVLINTRTHLIEGVSFSQVADQNDYRKPAWEKTGSLYNEYIEIGEFPYIKRNDWRLDETVNRPQSIKISCAAVDGIRIYYDYLYF